MFYLSIMLKMNRSFLFGGRFRIRRLKLFLGGIEGEHQLLKSWGSRLHRAA